MSTIQEIRNQVATLTTNLTAISARITSLDRALGILQASVVPPTPTDVDAAVDTAMDAWLVASGDFRQGHTNRAAELPIGVQNGANSLYSCPSGQWVPGSIIGFINGNSLPECWLTQRSVTTFRLGGGIPAQLFPDLTIAERRELRVSYDLMYSGASGELTPSGFLSIDIADITCSGYYPSGQLINMEVSASGTEVIADTSYDWPDIGAAWVYDNHAKAWLNGNMVKKDPATPWETGIYYNVGEFVIDNDIHYECNTSHLSAGSLNPAFWDATTGGDLAWVNPSGARMSYELEPDDLLHVEIPRYS